MRYLKFFWNAFWRDRGKLARAVNVTVVSIPAALYTAASITRADIGPWWEWALFALGAAVIVAMFGIIRRAVDLEELLEPKMVLSCKVREQVQSPPGSPSTKWVQIVVAPKGATDLIDCEVQIVSIYRDGASVYDELLNCVWSNSTDIRRTIRAGVPQAANVCFATEGTAGLEPATSVLKVQVTRAMRRPEAATYRIEIAAHATNSKVEKRWFVLKYGGDFDHIDCEFEAV